MQKGFSSDTPHQPCCRALCTQPTEVDATITQFSQAASQERSQLLPFFVRRSILRKLHHSPTDRTKFLRLLWVWTKCLFPENTASICHTGDAWSVQRSVKDRRAIRVLAVCSRYSSNCGRTLRISKQSHERCCNEEISATEYISVVSGE